jgi:hypothetical protein
MTPQEYITHALNDFIVKFPQTRVRYEFDSLSDVHFIEVVPNNVYHLDEAYIAWESDLYDRFISLYPDQNICFISDDALVGLENVQLELIGSIFDIIYSTNRTEIIVDESAIKVTGFVSSDEFLYVTFDSNSLPLPNCKTNIVLQSNENLPFAA